MLTHMISVGHELLDQFLTDIASHPSDEDYLDYIVYDLAKLRELQMAVEGEESGDVDEEGDAARRDVSAACGGKTQ